MKLKNKMGKSRDVNNPYMIFKSPDGTWEWRVLKAYQSAENELNNPYARWYCAVRSPFTFGSWEYGDSYCKDVKENSVCVKPFEASEITSAK